MFMYVYLVRCVLFPSIAYAGRLAGDPPNTLGQGEAMMFSGSGSQTGTGAAGATTR